MKIMGININKGSSKTELDNDFFALIAKHNSHYGEVPRVIKLSWTVVSRVIVALAQNYEDFRNYGEYMYLNCRDNKDGTYKPKSEKARLLDNVLLFLGELPLDTSITYNDGTVGKRGFELQRLKRSSNTREEQLLCLELMVARCWYDLFIKNIPVNECRFHQYLALEYMYWECSVDNRLSILWENLKDSSDPVHTEGREMLYYKLFEAQSDGLLADIFIFLNAAVDNMVGLLGTPDYKKSRSPKQIKKRRANGVLVGFSANSASMRGVRGRPGPLTPMNLMDLFPLGQLLDHVIESYPIRV